MNHIARIGHPQLKRTRMFFRRFAVGVLAEPSLRGAMAIFATHTLGYFKRTATLLWRGVERVAREAFRRMRRFRTEFQDARHAFTNFSCERLVRARVLVLQDPSRIFGLENAAPRNRLHAAVAGC